MNMVDTIENAALEEWLTDKEIEFILANTDQNTVVVAEKVALYSFAPQSKFAGIKILKLACDLNEEEAQVVKTQIPDVNTYHATKGVYIGGTGSGNNDLLLELIKFLSQFDETFAKKMHADYLHFGSLTEEFEEDEESHRFFLELRAIHEHLVKQDSKKLVLFAGAVELRVTTAGFCLWDKTHHQFFVFDFSSDDCNVFLRNMQDAPACLDADWSAIEKSVTLFDKIGKFQASKTIGATKELYSYLESVQCLVIDYLLSNKLIEKIVYFHDETDADYFDEDDAIHLNVEEDGYAAVI